MKTYQYSRSFKNAVDPEDPLIVEGRGTLGLSSVRTAGLRSVASALNEKIHQLRGEWDGPMLCDGKPVSKEDQDMCDSAIWGVVSG